MNMYVTADSNWGIYKGGRPLVSIPAERRSMLEDVAGKVIVYGIGFIPDLPGQQPVKGCTNIVFTDGIKKDIRGAVSFSDLKSLRAELKKYPDEDIYVINNEKLYREFLKDTDVIHVTKLEYAYSADSFFEDLDAGADFSIEADSDEQYCFNMVYRFLRYERKKEK